MRLGFQAWRPPSSHRCELESCSRRENVAAIHALRSGTLALHKLVAAAQSLPPYSVHGATGG